MRLRGWLRRRGRGGVARCRGRKERKDVAFVRFLVVVVFDGVLLRKGILWIAFGKGVGCGIKTSA